MDGASDRCTSDKRGKMCVRWGHTHISTGVYWPKVDSGPLTVDLMALDPSNEDIQHHTSGKREM